MIRLNGFREVALVAECLRNPPHQRELVRRSAATLEIPTRGLRAPNLREGHRHVLDCLTAQPQPRLLLGRQLVIRIDQSAEDVDRFLIFRLIRLIRLVIVRPTELVERQEIDVAGCLR